MQSHEMKPRRVDTVLRHPFKSDQISSVGFEFVVGYAVCVVNIYCLFVPFNYRNNLL